MRDAMWHLGGYLRHLLVARTRHGVHSPFVFRLVEEVLRQGGPIATMQDVEGLRRSLLRDPRRMRVTDLGAGSRVLPESERRVSDIARNALATPRKAAILYKLARHFKPEHTLELGTSLGLSTMYLARGAAPGKVITIEGCPAIHRLASEHFAHFGQENITALEGDFRAVLPNVLQALPRLDLAYIDGHHAEEPTLDYFDHCLAKAHNDTVFVLDDIHWSRGMARAWETVKAHPQVTVTIDLHDMGLVFLRQEQAREHFTLRY